MRDIPTSHLDFLRTLQMGRQMFNKVDIGIFAAKLANKFEVLSMRMTLGYSADQKPDQIYKHRDWFAARIERDTSTFEMLMAKAYQGGQFEIDGLPHPCDFNQVPANWFRNGTSHQQNSIWGESCLRYQVGGSWGQLFENYDDYTCWVNLINACSDIHDLADLIKHIEIRQPCTQYSHARQLHFELEFPLYLQKQEIISDRTQVHFRQLPQAESWRIKWKSREHFGITSLRHEENSQLLDIPGRHTHLEIVPLFGELALGSFNVRPVFSLKPIRGFYNRIMKPNALTSSVADKVLELEQLAQSSSTDLLELLRRAKVIASRLLLGEDAAWIDQEIQGYQSPTAVPPYRIIPSELRVRNPYHGWNPVAWGGPGELQAHFASASIRLTIAEIVDLLRQDGEPSMSLAQSEMDILSFDNPDFTQLPSARFFARASFVAITEAVRTRVLNWSLALTLNESSTIKQSQHDTKDYQVTRTPPRMFIGSTAEALNVARAVQQELDHDMEITLWNQNVFEPGNATWLDLVDQARSKKFDFALLVLGAEDQVISRGVTSQSPRDNVLLELGLFAGALGRERTLFLYDRSNRPKIASDLAGIMALQYRGDRSDENLRSAVGPACEEIRKHIKRLTKEQ